MQIIIVEPDQQLRDIFSVNLVQSLGAEVIAKENAKEAWAMVELLEPSLIIAKDKLENESTVDFIVQKLIEEKINIPIISIGLEVRANSSLLTILPEQIKPELLATTAKAILKREHDKIDSKIKIDKEKDQDKNYQQVPINLFKYFAEIPFDIFIRLKRGSDYQYLKRINANEGYDLNMIDSYIAKDVRHFFIEIENYDELTKIMNKRFKDLLSHIDMESKSKEEIQDFVLGQLTASGFNESNLQLAQESITKINNKIQSSNSKLGLITEIYNSQLGYRFRRSYMVSVIGALMLKNVDWAESKYCEYLTMAAYVHDMFLQTKEEMEISSDQELEQAFLGKERERVESHALLAANQVKSNDKIPAEVEKIVRGHHGSHRGEGYPREISSQVKKLSVAFLVAEEFSVKILCSQRAKINLNEVFLEITKKYETNKEIPKYLEAIRGGLKKK